jgi:CubicO group peptidase (beta-lactamase class C family)
MFTAAAVLSLDVAGALTMDTPLVELLPPERRPSTLLPAVTVHHLLCHTSGIADYCEEDEESPAYLEDYGTLWDDLPCYRVERPADFLPLFADLPPYRPPGERFQYCNAGYLLLGLVIEEVTGQAYADAVAERVLSSAGLTGTGFPRLDEPEPGMATGYLERGSADAPWRTNVYRIPVVGGADGGAFSTVGDLDRWLRAYAAHSVPGAERMLTAHADAGDGFREGYGVHLYPDGRFGHGGGDPGVAAIANHWPGEDLSVVVLTNAGHQVTEARDLLLEAARRR